MNAEAADLWSRALQALRTAKSNLAIDPDAAASRAYYVAFYAVSALFALQGKTFSKHSALRGALHRDLIKAGHVCMRLHGVVNYRSLMVPCLW